MTEIGKPIDRLYPVTDHRVGLHDSSYKGEIKVGDVIIANSWGGELRTGVIKMINIAMSNHDVAAENDEAVSTQVYDTRLEYQGSVSYGDNFWCYFNQIIRKEKYDE